MERIVRTVVGAALALTWLSSGYGWAQANRATLAGGGADGVRPEDPKQAARFAAVTQAVARRGYADPVVVGASKEPDSALFVVRATRAGKSLLVALIEPGKSAVTPSEIEPEMLPGDVIRMVRFEPFLEAQDLVDVIVQHEPRQLEISYSFDRHHVLRRKDAALALACSFNGNSTSAYAKGPRSVRSTRTVSVEKVPGGATAFDLKAIDETTETPIRGAAPSTTRSEQTTRYEMSASGMYEPVKK